MAKLWILAVLALVGLIQITKAGDLAEALNGSIRAQLNLYEKFQKEADSAKYADELKKLVDLAETALKSESADEKNQIISSAPSKFSEEFNNWLKTKLEEDQINSGIHAAIEFYKSLVSSHAEHEAEIKMAISGLEDLLKESDLKQKREKFFSFDKSFSADFKKFLQENALPEINSQLKKSVDFFDNLLKDKDNKFAKEINDLKDKTAAALEANVSTEDKTKILKEISFTDNQELNLFLQKKNIEYS